MNVLPDTLILPGTTKCGRGYADNLLQECLEFGGRGMVVHGVSLEKSGVLKKVVDNAPENMIVATWQHSGGEPNLGHVSALLKECRLNKVDWVAAIGGGSVIDLAKVCAGLFNAKEDISIYHDGKEVEESGAPFVAVPTTAGTGSEATIVSVLINEEQGVKKSIRHPSFMARLVILDPDLLSSCSSSVIASSGMDAYTQAIESYSSNKATVLSDMLSLKGLELIASSLEQVYDDSCSEARDDLLLGSYLTGVALSFSRLGVVHGLAHPLGVRYHQPHGLVCAVCLPPVLEINKDSLGGKYEIMSNAVGMDLIEKTQKMMKKMEIVSPFTEKEIIRKEEFIEEALASGSTAANPKKISSADVESLLGQIFG